MTRRLSLAAIVRTLAVGVVVLLGLLPVSNWIPGGHQSGNYRLELTGWLSGSAIVVGLGVVLALLSRRIPVLWRPGSAGRLFARADPESGRALGVVALAALVVYAVVALLVFSGRPLNIDEMVQSLQARMYAAGRLWEPEGAHPAFRNIMNMAEHNGRVFGHFPPGGPLWLVPGEWLHATWLMVPLAGALSVVGFGLVLRRLEPRPAVRGGALLLFALAPFAAFMAGSHLNHTTVLMWLLFFAAALLRVMDAPERLGIALAAGVTLGLAAITRPAEALAFGGAAGVWVLTRAVREPGRWAGTIAAMAIGAALPVAGMLWVNLETTGSPFRTGYELLWGSNVGLGFHEAPFGPPHTPVRGLELVSLYLWRLNVNLFETPLPSLLPAGAALLLAPRLSAGDRWLLGTGGVVLLIYFSYWFDGWYPGPRFVHSLIPVAALWTARLPGLVRERTGDGLTLRSVCYGAAVAAGLALAIGIPIRWQAYAKGLRQMRWNVDRHLAAIPPGSLVFVHESWGAQVLARLWALGVTRPQSERLYRNVDLCGLEERTGELERSPRPRDPFAVLAPAMADSARLRGMPQAPDTTGRVLPGARYGPECLKRLRADLQGIALLPPILLARRRDLVIARDLGDLDTVILNRHPDRPVYLIRHPLGDSVPRVEPISRDSLLGLGAPPPAPAQP